MIELKSNEEIDILWAANQIVAEVMERLANMIKPGVTTGELDRVAEEMILKRGAKSAFKGYVGYPSTLCTSVNEQVVHGIPGKLVLKEGDILSVDCGVVYKGFYGDHAWTFPVGQVDAESEKLLNVGREALAKGIEKAVTGKRLFDISAAIQSHAEGNGMSVVRDYVGHGIGRKLHEEPQVPNFGEAGTGIVMRPGLVIAIEPMINLGTWQVKILPDEWTVVTEDGKRSVHFEHSIAITEKGPLILSMVD